MLAHRIIPTLLARGKSLVKGRQFKADRVVGHAQQAVRIHQQRGVDELILLDIDATKEGRGPNVDLVGDLSSECFMPLTVGGGVRSVEDVKALLDAGADKVAICTMAMKRPALIQECSDRFGSQAIVVSMDVAFGSQVASECGNQFPITGKPADVAMLFQGLGAGEILLTSIDREGTMIGYDMDLIHEISQAVSIPVVAHGGCGTTRHALEAIQAGASAVAIGAMFTFTDETPRTVAEYLDANGIEVRKPWLETCSGMSEQDKVALKNIEKYKNIFEKYKNRDAKNLSQDEIEDISKIFR